MDREAILTSLRLPAHRGPQDSPLAFLVRTSTRRGVPVSAFCMGRCQRLAVSPFFVHARYTGPVRPWPVSNCQSLAASRLVVVAGTESGAASDACCTYRYFFPGPPRP